MYNDVELTSEGYYRYKNMPKEEDLKHLYEEEYFIKTEEESIENKVGQNYKFNYTEDEIIYINNESEKIYYLDQKLNNVEKKSFLDIGCGEGFALNFFDKKGYQVTGLDLNKYACENQNKRISDKIILGDLYRSMDKLINNGSKFDLIVCMNVLEHVLWPNELIKKAKSLLTTNGVFVVRVPNDFSVLQEYLWKKEYINKPYWVAPPDHISYFSLQSLKNLGNKLGLKTADYYMEFPIDINLLNKNTNYIINKQVGKDCAKARNELDNLMCEISIEETINVYRSFAELGIGRNICIYYQHDSLE